jgi:hypothetical protein
MEAVVREGKSVDNATIAWLTYAEYDRRAERMVHSAAKAAGSA